MSGMKKLPHPRIVSYLRKFSERAIRQSRSLNKHHQLHLLSLLACVAWRFWLGPLSNKGGRGQRNREEIGAEATCNLVFIFLAASPLVLAPRARFSWLRRSCARLDKTAMLRRQPRTQACSRYPRDQRRLETERDRARPGKKWQKSPGSTRKSPR